MDLSFANQALAAEFLVRGGPDLRPEVHRLPDEIDLNDPPDDFL